MTWSERFAHGAVLSFFAGLLYVAHQDPRPISTWSVEVAEAAIHRPEPSNRFSYQGEDAPVLASFPVSSPEVLPPPSFLAASEANAGKAPASAPNAAPRKEESRLGIYSLVETTPEMSALRRYLARRYGTVEYRLVRLFKTVETEARRYRVDPLLVVAVIAVESGFDPGQQSDQGAIGLMQVIPKWHLDKIDPYVRGEPQPEHLFDPAINVAVGIEVLAEGLARYRSLEKALQYYNGSLNDPQRRYSKKVLSLYRQLQRIAGVAAPANGQMASR